MIIEISTKKIWNWIIRKKEEEPSYPPEFAIITYTETALKNGVEDSQNKVIIRYRYNNKTDKLDIYRIYGYSDSLVYNLKRKLKIPVHDNTLEEIKFPIYGEIDLSEVSYYKG